MSVLSVMLVRKVVPVLEGWRAGLGWGVAGVVRWRAGWAEGSVEVDGLVLHQ